MLSGPVRPTFIIGLKNKQLNNMQKETLQIGGMHCGACATGIQMLVSGMDGVKSIFVDYEGKKADVEYDTSKIKHEDIVKGIGELGYTAA
jgi:copper chaperone CopZ